MTKRELASHIDQSALKPGLTVDEIKKYSQEGINPGHHWDKGHACRKMLLGVRD